jgi:hypothetical protein
VLGGLAAAPALLLAGKPAGATDYASAAEVFAAVDGAEAEVRARLRALEGAMPGARAFARSLLADLDRHGASRARLRRRLTLAAAAVAAGTVPAGAPEEPLSLEGLRAAQERLLYAHAEGLPAIGDAFAVDTLARHMVDLSRHLTVTALWMDVESERG